VLFETVLMWFPLFLAAIHGLTVIKHLSSICVVRGVKMIVISVCNSDS
jgi:hypothetical protein